MFSANGFVARVRGLAASIGLIISVSTVWFASNSSVCQAVVQQRSPVITGCVVDNDPTSYSTNGDAVEDRMLIGHINGTERRTVLEFNVADLVPGQVDVARLTGSIGPNNSFDSGVRQHNFCLAVGDGALTVSDNVTAGTNGIGWFNHNSGETTDFNYEITRAVRGLMITKPSYLRRK